MRKLFIITIAAATMMSCGGKQQSGEEKADVNEFSNIAANMDKEHNAKLSLDVDGIYGGIIPSAGGEGVDVTITLSGDKYTKKITYIGKKDSTTETKGSFTWDEGGNIITLSGEEAPNKYFVSENVLIQLDIQGKRVTGALADNYKLTKE